MAEYNIEIAIKGSTIELLGVIYPATDRPMDKVWAIVKTLH